MPSVQAGAETGPPMAGQIDRPAIDDPEAILLTPGPRSLPRASCLLSLTPAS